MSAPRNTPGAVVDASASPSLLARPLSARSVLASLLLGMHPPRLSGARLVAWSERFGIAEGTTRVALSRMVDRGELRAVGGGVYELAGRVRARQDPQDFALEPRLAAWAGDWTLAVVGGDARPARTRARLQEAARALRLAPLRPGVWCRPDNLPAAAARADAVAVVDGQCARWTARPPGAPVELAAQLFAPDEWAQRARSLTHVLASETAALRSGDAARLAEAFTAGAAVLAHVRADPLLPRELLGGDWPGDALRAAYRSYRDEFAAAIRTFFRER